MSQIPPLGSPIQVRPRYADGQPKTGWTARLIYQSPHLLILRGPPKKAVDLDFVQIELSDVFSERYWFDRWYNIFSLHDEQGQLKGWYANLCTPINFDGATIRYTDLDMDLWAWPDGDYVILDEEEFEQRVVLAMPPSLVKKARAALDSLIQDLRENGPLFQDPPAELRQD
ncbi:MAG: DUF402 domain-containing protein [Chloroflexia bacterium]|nr:DUF402 domain-containing protein [Chloroflexia bacterium]